jgi:hypothetical protein
MSQATFTNLLFFLRLLPLSLIRYVALRLLNHSVSLQPPRDKTVPFIATTAWFNYLLPDSTNIRFRPISSFLQSIQSLLLVSLHHPMETMPPLTPSTTSPPSDIIVDLPDSIELALPTHWKDNHNHSHWKDHPCTSGRPRISISYALLVQAALVENFADALLDILCHNPPETAALPQ